MADFERNRMICHSSRVCASAGQREARNEAHVEKERETDHAHTPRVRFKIHAISMCPRELERKKLRGV